MYYCEALKIGLLGGEVGKAEMNKMLWNLLYGQLLRKKTNQYGLVFIYQVTEFFICDLQMNTVEVMLLGRDKVRQCCEWAEVKA